MLYKRTALFLSLIMILQQAVFPMMQDEKIVIAVVDFQNTGEDTSLDYLERSISESLTTELANSGKLKIVERSLLTKALQEQKFGMSGIVDEETAVEVGRKVGANAILLGSFVAIGKQIRINARLIDVLSGEIIMAKNVTGNPERELFELMDELATSLIQQFSGTAPSPSMASNNVAETRDVTNDNEGSKEPETVIPAPAEVTLKKKPFYKSFWFWAAVLVGTGGIITALVIANQAPESSDVTIVLEDD